jgi:hypothetical protein
MNERPAAADVEWEVLPPEEKTSRTKIEPLFKWLALIMDDLLRLPGTNFRFGLDPLLGLLPGIGDTTSAFVSALALIHAAGLGVPRILLARMSLNILINEVIGIIPVLGDAFSFWFKSNVRNYDLLKNHVSRPGLSKRSDWIFVVAVLAILLFVVVIGIAVSFWILREVASFFGFE